MAAIWPELHRLLKPGGTLAVAGRLRPPGRLFETGRKIGQVSNLLLPRWPMHHRTGSATIA
jgi:hypothetical protein